MVALPSHLEQRACIRIPLREGFGVQRKARKITGDQLLAAIDEVVKNPAYREHVQRHRASVGEASGAEKAADIILDTVRKGIVAGARFNKQADAPERGS
jgi:UDP:flavonoid glycosyltransferase YjiC (YdhE family)